MPVIANNAKPSKAKILRGTDDFTGHVNTWRLKNSTPMEQVTDVGGTQRTYVGDPTFTLDLDVSQDWAAGSFADLLWTGRGTQVTIIVQDSNATWTCLVTLILPPEFGADFGKVAHNVVSLPVQGVPTRAAAV